MLLLLKAAESVARGYSGSADEETSQRSNRRKKKINKGRWTKDEVGNTVFTSSACKQRTFYMRVPSCFRILHYSHKCNNCPWSERCSANFLSCVVMGRILRPGTSWPMFANSFITVFFSEAIVFNSVVYFLYWCFKKLNVVLTTLFCKLAAIGSVFDGLLSVNVATCGLVYPSECWAPFQICSSVATDPHTG